MRGGGSQKKLRIPVGVLETNVCFQVSYIKHTHLCEAYLKVYFFMYLCMYLFIH